MPNLLVTRGAVAAPKAEQRLECGPRLPATVGPEDELIEVDLELPAAHSVVSTHKPYIIQHGDAPSQASGHALDCSERRKRLRLGHSGNRHTAAPRSPGPGLRSRPSSPSDVQIGRAEGRVTPESDSLLSLIATPSFRADSPLPWSAFRRPALASGH
jgi:hypothetical protein